MGRPRTSDNVALFTRLTEQDIDTLARARKRRRARTLSTVLERAVALIETTDLRRDGLRIPACIGRPIPRAYRVSPRTLQLLQTTSTELGYRPQDLLRAAITNLERHKRP